jgi:chromosome partitioning protein
LHALDKPLSFKLYYQINRYLLIVASRRGSNMGRIIAVTNLKGGIGKTTTVVNVGAGLALKGARVLLVDVDAQGNLAPSLGITTRHTIYEMLVDNARPEKCITSARPNLDMIAADDALLNAQNEIARRSDWSRVLEQALRPLKREYEFIIIDAPGSLTPLSLNAIAASNDLLVPTTVEHLSVKGLALLFKQVMRLKNSTGSIRMIVPTMFDSRMRQSAAMLTQLQATYGTLIAPPIRVNVRISEATSQGQTIYEFDRRSRGALDYARLVDRLSDLWNFQSPRQKQARTPAPVPVRNGHTPHQTMAENAHSAHAHVPAKEEAVSLSHVVSSTPVDNPIIAEPAAPPPPAEKQAHRPMVQGEGNMSQLDCPNCGRALRRTTVAGYRVAFCDHCKYKRQELLSRTRE